MRTATSYATSSNTTMSYFVQRTLAALLAALAFAQPTLAQDNPPAQTSTDDVVKALITAAQADDRLVRMNTLPLLGEFLQGRDDVIAVFVAATEDPEAGVRKAALSKLLTLDDPQPEVLAVIVKRGVEFGDLGYAPRGRGFGRGVNRSGISGLGQTALPHLIEVLESDAGAKFKVGACQVLQHMQTNGVGGLPMLLKIISDNDADAQVRIAAAEAATTIANAAQPVAQQQVEIEPRYLRFAEGLVQQNDKDGDGQLSPEEFPATKIVDLPSADFDGDGKLTPQEIARQMAPDRN